MPHRQDGVVVYGYPEGGNEISITKGIISRIEHTEYVHSKMDLLTLQIDAAINSGNSGGPALNKKGEIVGIAMQSLTSADNIGYLIPPQIIEHFLNDIKDGNYDGFPDNGLFIQSMENKNLKKYYNMSDRTGVLITRVAIDGSSNGYLQKGDVILEVDSMKIADDNSIPIRGNGRVSSNYLIRKHQVGDVAHIKLLRKGNEMMVDIPLKKKISFIPFEHEKRPRYYIYGGMVFMPLTRNYLQSSARKTVKYGSERFIQTVFSQHKTNKEKKEIVFLKSVLTDKENTGYLFQNYIVEEVNGNKVRSLNDFISLIETSNTKDIKISLDNGALIVMNKNDSEQSNQKLMERYNISKSSYLE